MSNLPKKASDAVNNFGIVLVGVVSAILTWASVVALQAYYKTTARTVEEERLEKDQEGEVRELKAAQLAHLQDWTWVDQKKGLVAIPVARAKELVLRDAQAGAPSLVPAIGAHDTPTVPAEPGRPADVAPAAPAAPAPAGATPAAAGAPAATPAPTPAAPAPAAPAPAAPAPAAPVPAPN